MAALHEACRQLGVSSDETIDLLQRLLLEAKEIGGRGRLGWEWLIIGVR